MEECVFCDIVAGRALASVVYDDERVIAFLDTGPINAGHMLVVSKQHIPSLAAMDEATGMHLFAVTMRVAAAIRRSGIRCEGINLFLADGEAAFQEVFHLHMHVVPRFVGDAFRISADWSARPERAELDAVAAKIRRAVTAP